MSIASRIQEIETHIGDIYDTLEVGGTDLTDLNKNIVNINSSLKDRYKYFLNNGVEVIWNNWEKVIGEGTEFTLENTIQAPMKVNLKGNTYQKSTTGKNLLNGTIGFSQISKYLAEYTKTDEDITITTSSTNQYAGVTAVSIPIENGNTYTVSMKATYDTNGMPNFRLGKNYNDVANIITTGTRELKEGYYLLQATFTANSNFVLAIAIYPSYTSNNTETHTSTFYDLQIESGSVATDYEEYTGGIASPNPEFSQDIQVVSGDNTIEVVGKNLFDKDNAKHYSTNGSGNTTTTTQFNSTDYIPCNSGDSFTISGIPTTTSDYNLKVVFFDSNKNYISRPIAQIGTINVKGSYSTTAPTNAKYVMAQFYNTLEEAQFEKGTSTTYEPYQKESYPINLGDIELCEIGDYQDYFYKDNGKWYLHKETGKVVLDGSEDWTKSTSMSADGYFGAYATNYHWGVAGVFANKNNFIINYFLPHDNTTGDFQFISSTGYACYLKINDSIANSVETLKTWLSTHNTEVYYVLATPTYTEITDTTLLSQLEAVYKAISHDDQTNISQVNNDMPFKLEVTALKNI